MWAECVNQFAHVTFTQSQIAYDALTRLFNGPYCCMLFFTVDYTEKVKFLGLKTAGNVKEIFE